MLSPCATVFTSFSDFCITASTTHVHLCIGIWQVVRICDPNTQLGSQMVLQVLHFWTWSSLPSCLQLMANLHFMTLMTLMLTYSYCQHHLHCLVLLSLSSPPLLLLALHSLGPWSSLWGVHPRGYSDFKTIPPQTPWLEPVIFTSHPVSPIIAFSAFLNG